MNLAKLSVAVGVLGVVGMLAAESASAQVFVYGPPAFGPRVVARAVVPGPFVRRPIVTTYRAPVVSYGASAVVSAPVVPGPVVAAPIAPVYRAPAVVATTRVRPAVIGASASGYPRVYVPGQPLRNAFRFAIP